MFTPSNPNDRPLRRRQFALVQLVVLMALVCFWSAGLKASYDPGTPRPVREFLGVILAISGGAMVLYVGMAAFRYLFLRPPPP